MALQDALFSVSPSLLADHDEVVEEKLQGKFGEKCLKIVIPCRQKPIFLGRLRGMGINGRSLFHTSEGFASYVKELGLLQAAESHDPAFYNSQAP